jgi:prevent-host-death family protein
MCYSSKMTEVPSRELRNNTRDLIARANKGETIVITVDGIPMAELQPVSSKAKWVRKEIFFVDFVQADAAMLRDIREGLPTMEELDRRAEAMWDDTK